MVNASGAPRAAEASAWICGAGIQDRINGDPWNSTQGKLLMLTMGSTHCGAGRAGNGVSTMVLLYHAVENRMVEQKINDANAGNTLAVRIKRLDATGNNELPERIVNFVQTPCFLFNLCRTP